MNTVHNLTYGPQPQVDGSSSQPNVGSSSSPVRHFNLVEEQEMYSPRFSKSYYNIEGNLKKNKGFWVEIKNRIQAARDRQKSYADVRCKPLEFQVGDKVMLKVSPWKGVIRFGKREKLNPRYIRPYKVLAKVRPIAYRLELPQQLSKRFFWVLTPMLEKDMYDSWKSKMEVYMMNRQHGRMILESVENGPLIWPSIEENGVTKPKKYFELSATKAIQADCDVKATKIILQGLLLEVKENQEKDKIGSKPEKNGKRGFNQTQPPQSPVSYPPPQETSIEILHDHENVINSVQTFLRKFNRYSFFETPKVLLLAWDRVFEIKDALGNKQYKPEDTQELFRELSNDVQNIHEELAEYINTSGWNRPAFYDDDDDADYTIAIIHVLSTEKPIDSLSMGDEHLDTISATRSDEVIKSSVEDLVPIPSESEGIPEHMCDVPFHDNSPPLDVSKDQFEDFSESNDKFSSTDNDSFSIDNIDYVEASPHDSELVSLEVAEIVIPKEEEIEDDNLREKLLNVHLLIANIKALKDNPTPSSKLLTKSSSTSPKSFLEETNTFHNSLPEFENFYIDLKEISSGSTTTHFDISLPNYEAFSFNNDHIKEISSGSTTTHCDISLFEYDSFVFDPSNDQFPPTDRSDFTHEEFADELAHIISPPEYDCFYFWNLPDPGELMSILNFGIRENLSTTSVNLPVEDDHSPLLAYVVYIFLAHLTYPVIHPYLHPFGNEDTIFDPGITFNHVYSFKPGLSHRCGAFKKFNTHRSHLNKWPMIINGKNITILDVLLYHFYPP
nr:reverse transcriptase domain-containing protein [Tanacetum cinerariifolium]